MKTVFVRLAVLVVWIGWLLAMETATPMVSAQSQPVANETLPLANAPRATSGTTMQWVEDTSGGMSYNVTNALFASVLAGSADGDTVIVGSPNTGIGSHSGQGTAYINSRTGTGTWAVTTLGASDGAAGDHFGNAVAVSSDGNTILVSAYQATVSGHAKQGKVYVYTRLTPVNVFFQANLIAADGAANDYFGGSVALSSDGNTAVVGAYGRNSSRGAVYVFTRSGTTWSQQTAIPITEYDAAANDLFGSAVALSGDGNTVIGTATNKASNTGAAYAYIRSGSSWAFQNKFGVKGGVAGDDFGRGVALSNDGNTALISADNQTANGHALQGAVNFFTRSGATWSSGTGITSFDGAASDWFGFSVALSGDGSTAIIGAPNAVVSAGVPLQGVGYVLYGTGFSKQQKLMPVASDANGRTGWAVAVSGDGAGVWIGSPYLIWQSPYQGELHYFAEHTSAWWQQDEKTNSTGATNDVYGFALGLSNHGNTAIVGSLNNNRVDIYTRANGTWSPPANIASPDSGPVNFGFAVAVSGDGNTALIGEPAALVSGLATGAAYIITRTGGGSSAPTGGGSFAPTGGGWSAPTKLVAPGGAAGDDFGAAVALSADGSTAVIGAEQYLSHRGAVYVSTRSGNNWSTPTKLTAADGNANDLFGSNVALNGDGSTLLVGASWASNGTASTGAAYVFVRSSGVYSQQTKLAPGGSSFVNFGEVALSSDGNTALVGAPGAVGGGHNTDGSCFIYVRSGTVWSLQTGSSGLFPWDASDTLFGNGVGLSADGKIAAIGAPQVNGYGALHEGATYIYTRASSTWTMQAKLLATDGIGGDEEGDSVALSGDGHTVLSGAGQRDSGRGAFSIFDMPRIGPLFLPLIVR